MTQVLVVGGELAPAAQERARELGIVLASCPPYPSADGLISAVDGIEASAIVVRMGRVPAEAIERMPTLRVIAKHGVGVDGIDLASASSRGIPVLIAGGANTRSVAEQALALLLGVARSVAGLDRRLREGHWDKATYAGTELTGKSLGLIGLGAIGRSFLELLTPFGMTVRVYDPYLPDELLTQGAHRSGTVKELLASSDVVSLHCPLTADNRGMIGAEELATMRPGAILLNTARGELVDQDALVAALRDDVIGGAGLDTFADEPPKADSPLWTLGNLVASPHVGANTREARDRMGTSVVEQIAAYLADGAIDRRNLVNDVSTGSANALSTADADVALASGQEGKG